MKRVHSVSFFRHELSGYESENAGTSRGKFFANFMPTLVRAHYAAFPGWELRIHHDDRVMQFPYFYALQCMASQNVVNSLVLINMGHADTLCGSMLWRMLPMFDPDVEFFISRDVDSLPMHRDRVMVEEAIAAGADAHAILDSESHSGPLMGGMTGYRPAALRAAFPGVANLAQFLALAPDIDFNVHGSDQVFLNRIVWPKLFKKTLVHQLRQDVLYPEAMKTRLVAPKVTRLDHVVRHLGAGYDIPKAQAALDGIEKGA